MKTKIQKAKRTEVVRNAEVIATAVMPPSDNDFVTRVFHHPEMQALSPNGSLNEREKLIAVIAGQIKQDELYERQRQSAPERAFKMAFLSKIFGNSQPPFIVQQPAIAGESEKRKTVWDSVKSASGLVPIVMLLVVAVAGFVTAETKGWKSSSDALQRVVASQKEELKELREKNDQLQADFIDTLKQAGDQKQDFATLNENLKKIVAKYRNPTPPISNQAKP